LDAVIADDGHRVDAFQGTHEGGQGLLTQRHAVVEDDSLRCHLLVLQGEAVALCLQHLGLGDDLLHVRERVFQHGLGCCVVDSHSIGGQPVVGMDNFEMELRADPHGIGVDQLFQHEGAWIFTTVQTVHWSNTQILGIGQLFNQLTGLRTGHELPRLLRPLVGPLLDCSLVQIVQGVAALGVLLDGHAAYSQLLAHVLSSRKDEARSEAGYGCSLLADPVDRRVRSVADQGFQVLGGLLGSLGLSEHMISLYRPDSLSTKSRAVRPW